MITIILEIISYLFEVVVKVIKYFLVKPKHLLIAIIIFTLLNWYIREGSSAVFFSIGISLFIWFFIQVILGLARSKNIIHEDEEILTEYPSRKKHTVDSFPTDEDFQAAAQIEEEEKKKEEAQMQEEEERERHRHDEEKNNDD